jgi:hypothetical protein
MEAGPFADREPSSNKLKGHVISESVDVGPAGNCPIRAEAAYMRSPEWGRGIGSGRQLRQKRVTVGKKA